MTIVAVNKQGELYILSVCLSSCLGYPACKSNCPCFLLLVYCHLWPVWLYHIFPHYFIKGSIFGKLLNINCVSIFSTTSG